MTKDVALFNYFNGFMKSYPATAVPDDGEFPYLTYDYKSGSFGDGDIGVAINIWHYTESEAIPNRVADNFRHYIEQNDTIVCDEGCIWIKPTTPWCQALNDQTNPSVKRRYININIEYLTT